MSQEERNFAEVSPRRDVTQWEYNGFTFELDIGDADESERLEEAFQRLADADKTIPKTGHLKDIIIAQDKVCRDFFDFLLGEGAGDDVLGEKRSINNCNDAYESFLDFIDAQRGGYEERNAALLTRYSGNRAQRRAQTRGRS